MSKAHAITGGGGKKMSSVVQELPRRGAPGHKGFQVSSVLVKEMAGTPPSATLRVQENNLIESLEEIPVGVLVTYRNNKAILVPYANIRHIEYA